MAKMSVRSREATFGILFGREFFGKEPIVQYIWDNIKGDNGPRPGQSFCQTLTPHFIEQEEGPNGQQEIPIMRTTSANCQHAAVAAVKQPRDVHDFSCGKSRSVSSVLLKTHIFGFRLFCTNTHPYTKGSIKMGGGGLMNNHTY